MSVHLDPPKAYRTINKVKESEKMQTPPRSSWNIPAVQLSIVLCVNVQATSQSKPVVNSDSSIQRQEVDVQKEDGIYEEGFLRFEFITDE